MSQIEETNASDEPCVIVVNTKQAWSRSDKLATWAIFISLLTLVVNLPFTFIATSIASRADERARQAEAHGAKAVATTMVDKVKLLTQDAENSGVFLEGFISHSKKHPADLKRVQQLTLEFLQNITLPVVDFSTEQMTLLAHEGNDAAMKLALCVSRRDEVQSDITSVAGAKNYQVTYEQDHTLQILPYRLNILKETCGAAAKDLASIAPDYMSVDRPLRGTIGELAAAQKLKMLREKSGPMVTLELAKPKNKN